VNVHCSCKALVFFCFEIYSPLLISEHLLTHLRLVPAESQSEDIWHCLSVNWNVLIRILVEYNRVWPIPVAARSEAWTVRPIKHWNRGFKTHLRHGCLCAFILFVLFCVHVAALQQADPPSKESYRLCKRSRTWKSAKVQRRTVEPQRDR
jgi:hypothetical protein